MNKKIFGETWIRKFWKKTQESNSGDTKFRGKSFMNKKVKKIVNKISTRKNILLAKKFHNVRDKILLIWRKKVQENFWRENFY